MRHRFEQVVEGATGRRVIGFMSGNQQDPDVMCEVFHPAPSDTPRGGSSSAISSLEWPA